jgi:hypothetical protein
VLTCHWIVAAVHPVPSAPSATVKLAAAGAVTVVLTGCVPITGAVVQGGGLTVSFAPDVSTVAIVNGPVGFEIGLLTALVNSARYS